jgi:exonuclease SbcC
MLIERLELKNFEGYRHAEVEFARGLNVITGRNSTGKTTILEALLFALYGGAPGLEKKLLVSKLQNAAGPMSVKLVANMQGKRVEILREGRLIGKENEPKRFRMEKLSLKIDGKEVPVNGEEELNRKVCELAGMGVKMFTTLLYARQGEIANILEPKKEDMDLILGISLIKELVEQLDSARKLLEKYEGKDAKTMLEMFQKQLPEITSQINHYKRHVSYLESNVQKLEEIVSKAKSKELKELLKNIEQRDALANNVRKMEASANGILGERGVKSLDELKKLAEEVAKKEGELESEINRLEEEEKRINSAYNDVCSKLNEIETHLKSVGASTVEDLEKQIASTEEQYTQITNRLQTEQAKLNETEKTRNMLDGKIKALEEDVKTHERLLAEGRTSCPTCGQKIDPEMLEQMTKDERERLQHLKEELDVVEGEYQKLKATVNELSRASMQLSNKMDQLQNAYNRIVTLLAGKKVEELGKEKSAAEKDLEGIRETIKVQSGELTKIRTEKDALLKALNNVVQLEKERGQLEEQLRKCLELIRTGMQALAFPFQPEDPDLKVKIAEQLPLSLEELTRRENDLRSWKEQLNQLKSELERLQREEQEMREKVAKLQERLGKAKVCEELLEKIKGRIESQREIRLRRIADEALRIYETLTDQRVYKAFRINRDDYSVEVFPSRLEGYIPAKRTGGGHQTLFALAVRIALLHVLNQRNLLILDEPTYGVDSENLPQLMSYFSEVAKKLEQTVLVTHYGLGEEEAVNVIKVSLAPDGSSVAWRSCT